MSCGEGKNYKWMGRSNKIDTGTREESYAYQKILVPQKKKETNLFG